MINTDCSELSENDTLLIAFKLQLLSVESTADHTVCLMAPFV